MSDRVALAALGLISLREGDIILTYPVASHYY